MFQIHEKSNEKKPRRLLVKESGGKENESYWVDFFSVVKNE